MKPVKNKTGTYASKLFFKSYIIKFRCPYCNWVNTFKVGELKDNGGNLLCHRCKEVCE